MSNPHEPLGRFRNDLVIKETQKEGGGTAFHVFDPISQVAHVMTELELVVAKCMDGQRTADAVAREAAKRGHTVQAAHVERFHRELDGMSFVYRDAQEPLIAPDHRGDAAQFIEDAKREIQLGRMEVARDLIAAALEIDHATVIGVLEAELDSFGERSHTSPTVDIPLASDLEISFDSTTAVPRVDRMERQPPRWLLPALLVTACAAGAHGVADVMADAPSIAAASPLQTAPAAPAAPALPSTARAAVNGVIEKAERRPIADVIAPWPGRFVRNPMKPGALVDKGQNIGVVVVGDRRIPVVAKAAGVVEFALTTGAIVKRGDVVAVVREAGSWRATARISKLELPWDCSVLVGDAAGQPCELSTIAAEGSGARVVAVARGAFDLEEGKLVLTPRR